MGGLSPHSTCDWPGQLVATVFTQGCPWACAYCHNPHLMGTTGPEALSWDEVVAFLRTRAGLLDGVVFSGGEPTQQDALPSALDEALELGFQVGLHTAGQFPDMLARVLPSVDWVGFDVKAPWDAYERITGVAGSGETARESLMLLAGSGVDLEARTTIHPDLLSPGDVDRIADELVTLGVRRYAVQSFRPQGCEGNLRAISLNATNLPAGLADRFEQFEFRDS